MLPTRSCSQKCLRTVSFRINGVSQLSRFIWDSHNPFLKSSDLSEVGGIKQMTRGIEILNVSLAILIVRTVEFFTCFSMYRIW